LIPVNARVLTNKTKKVFAQSRKVAKKSSYAPGLIQDSKAVDSLCALCGFARDGLGQLQIYFIISRVANTRTKGAEQK
jgi:hypothetical protein